MDVQQEATDGLQAAITKAVTEHEHEIVTRWVVVAEVEDLDAGDKGLVRWFSDGMLSWEIDAMLGAGQGEWDD